MEFNFFPHQELYLETYEELQKINGENMLIPIDERKKIALNIGIKTTEWEAVQGDFFPHFRKAKQLLNSDFRSEQDIAEEYFNWIESLFLLDAEAYFDLAKTYQKRFKLDVRASDGLKARAYADKCLSLQPTHKGAKKIQNQLSPKNIEQTVKNGKKDLRLGLLVFFLVGGFICFLMYKAIRLIFG